MPLLEELTAEYALAKVDRAQCQSMTARKGISDAMYYLQKKIDAEEVRVKNDLQVIELDGKEYRLPRSCSYRTKQNTYSVDDVFYFLEDNQKLDEDKSYHWHHYVWIPQREDKYVSLCIRTLGGDRFGDRFFLEASYYKHPADQYSYMTKHVYPNNRVYRPYIEYVLNKLGLEFDKSSREANALKWIEKREGVV